MTAVLNVTVALSDEPDECGRAPPPARATIFVNFWLLVDCPLRRNVSIHPPVLIASTVFVTIMVAAVTVVQLPQLGVCVPSQLSILPVTWLATV